jgi:hypothetical protein
MAIGGRGENLRAKGRRAVSKLLVAVILVLVVAVAGGAGYYATTLQQPLPSPSPSPSTSETSPSSQIVTPTPSSSPSGPVVTITYSRWMGPLGTDLFMNIAISNSGYPSFDVNSSKFFAVLNGAEYKYEIDWTRLYGSWKNSPISNGETYTGTLLFSVPKSDSLDAYTLHYDDASNSYNIAYVSK